MGTVIYMDSDTDRDTNRDTDGETDRDTGMDKDTVKIKYLRFQKCHTKNMRTTA
jgi:hypothetical protein